MQLEIDGMQVYYETTGNGKDILFLHGWGSSTVAFSRMIRNLSSRYRCTALDFPGCGETDLPQAPYTIEKYCAFVLEFIQKAGLANPILIGHSNGGRVILNLCMQGALSPQKIVLFGAAGLRSPRTFRQKWRGRSFKAIKRVLTLPVIKNYSEDLLAAARQHYGSADYNAAVPVMRQTLVNLLGSDLLIGTNDVDNLKKIKASTLLIFGENDTATPVAHGKIMEEKIADSGLCVIQGGTHWCFVEFPDQIDAILNSFL